MVTVEMSHQQAEQFLMDRGWKIAHPGDRYQYYVKPEGENHLKGGVEGIDFVTDIEKAVGIALGER